MTSLDGLMSEIGEKSSAELKALRDEVLCLNFHKIIAAAMAAEKTLDGKNRVLSRAMDMINQAISEREVESKRRSRSPSSVVATSPKATATPVLVSSPITTTPVAPVTPVAAADNGGSGGSGGRGKKEKGKKEKKKEKNKNKRDREEKKKDETPVTEKKVRICGECGKPGHNAKNKNCEKYAETSKRRAALKAEKKAKKAKLSE